MACRLSALERSPPAAASRAPAAQHPASRWGAARDMRGRRSVNCRAQRRAPAGLDFDTWNELDSGSCILLPNGEAKALIHFLGGAFVGRAPHVTYQIFCRELCDAGYAVATTPYGITFEHIECALRVAAARDAIISEAFDGVRPSLVFGVGHSNGALLHGLMASLPEAGPPAAANVLISYNNKSVKDAVPFGLEGSGGVVSAAQAAFAALPPPPLPPPGPLRDLATGPFAETLSPIINQLGSAFDEIARGKTEFFPAPQETRRILSDAYAAPSTLFVRFSNDSIDETEETARALTTSATGAPTRRDVQILRLYGSHVTPCGADLGWPVGQTFTPADAIAQAAKAAALLPTRLAARQVARWLDSRVRIEQQRVASSGGGGRESDMAALQSSSTAARDGAPSPSAAPALKVGGGKKRTTTTTTGDHAVKRVGGGGELDDTPGPK